MFKLLDKRKDDKSMSLSPTRCITLQIRFWNIHHSHDLQHDWLKITLTSCYDEAENIFKSSHNAFLQFTSSLCWGYLFRVSFSLVSRNGFWEDLNMYSDDEGKGVEFQLMLVRGVRPAFNLLPRFHWDQTCFFFFFFFLLWSAWFYQLEFACSYTKRLFAVFKGEKI